MPQLATSAALFARVESYGVAMGLRGLSVRDRRIVAVVAGCGAFAIGGVRVFLLPEDSVWDLLLVLLQGVATMATWFAWRSLRPPRASRGVDMDAKRLHW